MSTSVGRRGAMLVFSIVLLALAAQPARFEPHEPQRAGLLALLVLIAAPDLYITAAEVWRLGRGERVLLLVGLGWAVALVVSSTLALSPAQAVLGDALRRMGLWTHLALAAGLLVGAWLSPARGGRLFWLAGVITAAHLLWQAGLLHGVVERRPPGLFGSPTLTAGWLILALLWALWGGWPAGRGRLWLWAAGLGLMLAALVVTETRGSAVALAAGVLVGGLGWAAWQRSRRALALLALPGLLVAALLVAYEEVRGFDDVVEHLPLLGRFFLDEQPDTTRDFRQQVWTETLGLAQRWPVLVDVEGTPDAFAVLRPWVGYGLEGFELVHRQVVSAGVLDFVGGQRIDRAHNDALDTLIMLGGLGLGARLALWATAWWLMLRRLNATGMGAWLLPVVGLIIGGWGALTTGLAPLAPAGMLAGAGLWLARCALRRDTPVVAASARPAVVALAVTSAHLVDLQFSFVTIANGWPAWLALGLLLSRPGDSTDTTARLAGLVWVVPLWGLGRLLQTLTAPALTALIEVGLVGASLWVLAGHPRPALRPTPARTLYAALILLGLALWWRDIAADTALALSLRPSLPAAAADHAGQAAVLRPWDARLNASAAAFALAAGRVDAAEGFMRRALALNRYDGDLALRGAELENALMSFDTDPCPRLGHAAQRYAAAARLSPTDPAVWAAWWRFGLTRASLGWRCTAQTPG